MLKGFFRTKKNKANKTILIVEDSIVERTAFSKTLEKEGYKVLCAEDGEEGLQLAQDEKPHLILLDCLLPGINGTEVCKRLKNIEDTKNIPIIFLTGSTTPDNIINCYDTGAEHFLAKPIRAKALLSQVKISLQEAGSVLSG